jgi:proteasome lid subunit RPN8/RPN11
MVGLTCLVLPSNLCKEMENDVRNHYPEEACGILAGRKLADTYLAQVVFPMENILHSTRRFRIDPQQQLNCLHLIQSHTMDIVAIYHSHPHGDSTPSKTDQAEHYDPQAVSLIWYPSPGRWEYRAYTIKSMGYQEIPIRIQQAA